MTPFVYRCCECGRTYGREAVRYLCPACGRLCQTGEPLRGVLEAQFDMEHIRSRFDKNRPDWSLFCAVEKEFHPAFPVGNTPFFAVRALGARIGFPNLMLKNDGLNPSGSLKDRASELVVAEAIRLGEKSVVTASTGNAAAALAAVCAATDRQAIIFVPEKAPRAKLIQILACGARVIRVRGTYDDAVRLSLAFTEKRGGLNRNTAYHPLTIEGKKTVALEIIEQSGWRAPDAVVVPVGDGVIIAGVHKGFRDLKDAGLIDRLPRLICVQAERSDAIHHLVETGHYRSAALPTTIADSISVSAPSNAILAKRAIEESDGFSVLVTDAEIREAQSLLAQTTGVFAEPAASASLAGLRKASPEQIGKTARVVLLITGHGLKDIEAASHGLVLPEPIEPDIDAIPRD